MDEKNRLLWPDIAKGIGIIFVMLSHSPIAKSFALYTYLFNMPLFFFLSGYFLNIQKHKTYWLYFKNLFQKILFPYAFFSSVSILFYAFYYHMPFYDYTTIIAMVRVFVVATRNIIFYNVPLWFLPTLFFVANAFYFVRQINKKYLEWFLLLALGSVFVIWWDTLYNPKLFWTIDTGLFYLMFFALGYYIKNGLINAHIKSNLLKSLALALSIFLNVGLVMWPNFYANFLYSPLLKQHKILYFVVLLLMALAGIYTIVGVSKIIKTNKILEYLGKNSLNYFALHALMFLIFNKTILQIDWLAKNLIASSLIYVLLTIILLLPINNLLNKCRPYDFKKLTNQKQH